MSAPVDPEWVAAQVAKFSADDLRRAGEVLLALSRATAPSDCETVTGTNPPASC